jgi:malate synthase
VREIEEAELEKPAAETRWDDARALFDRVALEEEFEEFLTLPAYEYLD